MGFEIGDEKMKSYYGAWNTKSKCWVKWLGYSLDKKLMEKRINKYCHPQIKHIIDRKIPQSSKWF